jgi:hypothetical protein
LSNAADAVLAFDREDNGDDEGDKLENRGISVRHDSWVMHDMITGDTISKGPVIINDRGKGKKRISAHKFPIKFSCLRKISGQWNKIYL